MKVVTTSEPYRELPILYVHDDPQAAIVLRYVLGDDFDIRSAREMNEALDLVATNDFSLILCDHSVLGVPGIEICARIREVRPDVLRIITTAYPSRKVSIDAIQAGHIAGHVSKPWHDPDFANLVRAKLDLLRMRNAMNALHSDSEVVRTRELVRALAQNAELTPDVSRTVRAVVTALEMPALIDSEDSLRALIDPSDLAQALALLLGHAAQNGGATIRVRVSSRDSLAVIALASGPGTWAPPSDSIGLSTAAHLVRRAAGELSVRSEDGSDDTLVVGLPIAAGDTLRGGGGG